MISWFNGWAKGIVLAVVIVTILEMILPDTKNKKYIKIVMGVYATFTIISPIISKLTGNNFTIDVSKYDSFNNSNNVQLVNNIKNINNQSIQNLYLNTIKTDIQEELNTEGYTATKIDITADINIEKEEAKIHKINLEAYKNIDENKVKKVNKVEIGAKEEKQDNNVLSDGEIHKLKEIINKKYEIEKEKIFINGK